MLTDEDLMAVACKSGYSLRTTFLCGILILGGYSVLYHFTGYQQLILLTRTKLTRIRLVDVPSTLTPTNAPQLEKCPETPTGLVGQIFVNMTEPPSFDAIARLYKNEYSLEVGGKWQPANCSSRSQLAVVMTYRNRTKNIKIFLQHLHGFLQKQLIQYQMFVIEPPPDTEFNRGLLKNIGFVESGKRAHSQCVVFHDIDLLPENDKNLYHCPEMPRHLVVAIDTNKYRPLFGGAVFGGAVLLKREHFQQINGFSNYYFGWGGEDDDLLDRIIRGRLRVHRPAASIGRYQEVKHKKDKKGSTVPLMYKLRRYRFKEDGLNNLEYEVIKVKLHPLCTWIYVTYNETFYRAGAEAASKVALEEIKKTKLKQKTQTLNKKLSNQTDMISSNAGKIQG